MANPFSSTTTVITTALDLPVEILQLIRQRLPLADYLRFPAVCTSWRLAAAHPPPPPFSDTEFPWLLSLNAGDEFASAVSLSPDSSLPPKLYSIPLPKRFQDYSLVSADGHLLMIEDLGYQYRPHNRGIYIVDPFDSWAQLGLLPSSTTLSADPAKHTSIGRVLRIAMNSSVAVAIWSYSGFHLAYTRLGIDRAWIDLKDTLTSDSFQDVVAYKDGLFCALDSDARKVVALDFSSSPTVRLTDLTLNLPAYQDPNDGGTCFQHARLVNSSSNLFLVRWRSIVKVGETKVRELDIHKLMDHDDAYKKWVPIESLGNSSFFLGLNQSISLSTATFPRLRSNCIYIPRDAFYRMFPRNYMCAATLDDDDDFRAHLIYDLGDEILDEYYSCESVHGLWMTPRLPSKSTCYKSQGLLQYL